MQRIHLPCHFKLKSPDKISIVVALVNRSATMNPCQRFCVGARLSLCYISVGNLNPQFLLLLLLLLLLRSSDSDTKITDGDILETVRAMRDLLLSKQLDIFRMNFVLEKMHLERKVV